MGAPFMGPEAPYGGPRGPDADEIRGGGAGRVAELCATGEDDATGLV